MSSHIEVTIDNREPRTVAFVSMKGPFTHMGEALVKLYGWIEEKGYITAGHPSVVYFNFPGQVTDDELRWELRCHIDGDVSRAVPDEQGIGIRMVVGMEVASTVHKGPLHEIGATYQALSAWLDEEGYEVAGAAEGVYLGDPAKMPPEELLIELMLPV